MVDVSIVIVNYNTFNLTSQCIRSIIKHTSGIRYEIILVDNASVECDPGLFLEEFPSIKLVKSSANLGFAKGNNAGIGEAAGKYILLINSDTWLIENSIKYTLDKFKTLKRPGFVGIKTLYADERIQFTCEMLPSLKNALARMFFITRFFKRTERYSKLDKDFSPEAIWGSYLFFEKGLLQHFKDNKLNEIFFMYHEDLLWCWEARRGGFLNYFIAGTKFIHIFKGSQSDQKVKSQMSQQFKDNFRKLEQIINGRLGYPIYRIAKKLISFRQPGHRS